MSEQKQSSFMQELDRWTESTIIGPLFASETDGEDWEPAIERVKKAIRQKVLESYRNGQVAGPRSRLWSGRREGRGNLALLFFAPTAFLSRGGEMHSDGISPALTA
jgi:hypothetical protein